MQISERVGIWAPNCAEWCIAQFASGKVGVILVNISPAYRLSELAYALKHSGCRWLICADAFKTSDYHAMLLELLPELAASQPGELRSAAAGAARGVQPGRPGAGRFPPLAAAGGPGRRRQCRATGHAPGAAAVRRADQFQYTSGTTGSPKGATLSHYNILNNGYMVGESLGLSEHDRLVIPVPLYHCFGMVMGNLGCLTHDSTMIYPAPSFGAEATLQALAEEKPLRCTVCRPCSSPSWITRDAPSSTCPACAPGSWPAPPARSR